MASQFDDLAELTAVIEGRALARFRDVLAEESQLRQELEEIDNLRFAALQDGPSSHARRISGVDTQWQSWLVQRRTAINQQLVLLQIRKADIQDAARLANAKMTVTSDLAADDERRIRDARRSHQEAQLRELTLLRQGNPKSI